MHQQVNARTLGRLGALIQGHTTLGETMRTEIIEALNTASKLITSQLDLKDCASHGEPILKEARCQQCLQLSACSWRYHSLVERSNNVDASTEELQRDFALAQLLLQQAVDQLSLSPDDHDEAKAWLLNTASLKSSGVDDLN